MLLGEEPIQFAEGIYEGYTYGAPPSKPSGKDPPIWGSDGFGFDDLLDVINPLQHVPVVSTIYRELTGDEIGYAPRLMGGALFGGAIGVVASLLNVLVEDSTGRDIGEHALALLRGDEIDGPGAPGTPAEPPVMVAGADGAAATVAAATLPAAGVAKPWINPDLTARPGAATPKVPSPKGPSDARDEPVSADPATGAAETEAMPAAAQAAAEAPDQAASWPTAGPLVPDTMRGALEKYEKMMRQRQAARGVDILG